MRSLPKIQPFTFFSPKNQDCSALFWTYQLACNVDADVDADADVAADADADVNGAENVGDGGNVKTKLVLFSRASWLGKDWMTIKML